jgi:transposase
MRGEVLGLERRRRWSDEEKLSILSMIGVGGMTVTQVAQRHDLTRQQIYTWRNVLKRKGIWHPDAALFLPVEMPEAPTATHAEPVDTPATDIELRLSNARALRFPAGIDGTVLTCLIQAIEAA